MREYIKAEDIANEIRMSSSTKVITLVEGDTDIKLFSQFFNPENSRFLDCNGKENIIEVFEKLKIDPKFNFDKVIFILDSDEDSKLDCKIQCENIFYTDSHDIETMVINSPAFDRLISINCNAEKINNFREINNITDLREFLIDNGINLGYIRCLSKKYGYNFKFRTLEFSKFIDKETLKVDLNKLIREIKNKSNSHSISIQEIINKIDEIKEEKDDPWLICSGHDLINIIVEALRKCWSNFSSKSNHNIIQDKLFHAYHIDYFRQTNLYKLLNNWQISKKNEIISNI